MSIQQTEYLIYTLFFTLGFCVAQLISECRDMRRIRKAVERFADDFSKEVNGK